MSSPHIDELVTLKKHFLSLIVTSPTPDPEAHSRLCAKAFVILKTLDTLTKRMNVPWPVKNIVEVVEVAVVIYKVCLFNRVLYEWVESKSDELPLCSVVIVRLFNMVDQLVRNEGNWVLQLKMAAIGNILHGLETAESVAENFMLFSVPVESCDYAAACAPTLGQAPPQILSSSPTLLDDSPSRTPRQSYPLPQSSSSTPKVSFLAQARSSVSPPFPESPTLALSHSRPLEHSAGAFSSSTPSNSLSVVSHTTSPHTPPNVNATSANNAASTPRLEHPVSPCRHLSPSNTIQTTTSQIPAPSSGHSHRHEDLLQDLHYFVLGGPAYFHTGHGDNDTDLFGDDIPSSSRSATPIPEEMFSPTICDDTPIPPVDSTPRPSFFYPEHASSTKPADIYPPSTTSSTPLSEHSPSLSSRASSVLPMPVFAATEFASAFTSTLNSEKGLVETSPLFGSLFTPALHASASIPESMSSASLHSLLCGSSETDSPVLGGASAPAGLGLNFTDTTSFNPMDAQNFITSPVQTTHRSPYISPPHSSPPVSSSTSMSSLTEILPSSLSIQMSVDDLDVLMMPPSPTQPFRGVPFQPQSSACGFSTSGLASQFEVSTGALDLSMVLERSMSTVDGVAREVENPSPVRRAALVTSSSMANMGSVLQGSSSKMGLKALMKGRMIDEGYSVDEEDVGGYGEGLGYGLFEEDENRRMLVG